MYWIQQTLLCIFSTSLKIQKDSSISKPKSCSKTRNYSFFSDKKVEYLKTSDSRHQNQRKTVFTNNKAKQLTLYWNAPHKIK